MSKYKYNLEQYFNILFRDVLKTNEYITLFLIHKDTNIKTQRHYKSIQDTIKDIDKLKHYYNIFVSLATTDGQGRATENLKNRSILGFDFDKKDYEKGFNYKDVLNRFSKLGIYYHMLVDSGHGYHAYVLADNTNNIDKLISVNKAIATRLGADIQAVKPTQVLRVPGTYNYKDKPKRVNIIWLQADKNKLIPYGLDRQYNKFCTATDTNIKYIKDNNIPYCIKQMLEGVEKGHRNFALGRLTKWLQSKNYSKNKAFEIIKEWNNKCNPLEDIEVLKNNFNEYWNKDYKLLGCISQNSDIQAILSCYCNKYKCNKNNKYEVIHVGECVEIEYKIADKIRYRGDKVMLDGNHIAIIGILKIHKAGLNTNQLKMELTSTITKKCRMSKPTLIKVLKELEQMDIIECIQNKNKTIPNLYKLKDVKCLENEKFNISYHAVQRYIDKAIGQSALRIYSYMLYKLSKGDNVVQEDLAKDLGVTQQAVSKSITELEQARYLIIETDYSINPLGANRYRWLV